MNDTTQPSFQGTNPNPVAAGGTLIIQLSNPARANQTVEAQALKIGSGESVPIQIVLDGSGHGSVKFPVPTDWGEPFLVLQAPGTPDFTVSVE